MGPAEEGPPTAGPSRRRHLPSSRVLGARRLRAYPVMCTWLRCLKDDRACAPASPGPSACVPRDGPSSAGGRIVGAPLIARGDRPRVRTSEAARVAAIVTRATARMDVRTRPAPLNAQARPAPLGANARPALSKSRPGPRGPSRRQGPPCPSRGPRPLRSRGTPKHRSATGPCGPVVSTSGRAAGYCGETLASATPVMSL